MKTAGAATLVVIASGKAGKRIARVASEHAAFDPNRRRVVRLESRTADAAPAALVIDADGEVCVTLSRARATSAAWIEDAFLRALRMKR